MTFSSYERTGLPPYFIEVFDDQNVGINDKISLKCVGTGHPIPMITWTLDGSELELRKREAFTLHKALVGLPLIDHKSDLLSLSKVKYIIRVCNYFCQIVGRIHCRQE